MGIRKKSKPLKVRFYIDKNGDTKGISIKETSGSTKFDKAVVSAIKKGLTNKINADKQTTGNSYLKKSSSKNFL